MRAPRDEEEIGKEKEREKEGEESTKASDVPDSSRFCRGLDVYFARTFSAVIYTQCLIVSLTSSIH